MPTGNLPASGKKLWERVYQDSKSDSCDEECAARIAWKAVKNAGWYKDENGEWHKKSNLAEFSMTITKAHYDESSGEMRWRMSASDTGEDEAGDSMTLELFEDFISRIESKELVPEKYRSSFWQGGMPYLSISHYSDLDGKGVPGMPDLVYIDGNVLKSKGTFYDTPLGRALFKSVCKDLHENVSNPIRVSIAFLDWQHTHKSDGFVFVRESLDDACPKCLESSDPLFYQKGHLVHLATTRVPMNKRTQMEVDKSMTTRKEDAESIVGEELAEELETSDKLVGKSEVMVVKSEPISEASHSKEEEDEMECEEGESPEDCKKRRKKEKYEKEQALKAQLDELLVEIQTVKSMVSPKESPSIRHPLQDVIERFLLDFDEAISVSNLNADERLQLLQPAFNRLGETVKESIIAKSAVQESALPDVHVEGQGMDVESIAKAFSAALRPIYEKIDSLSVQLAQPTKLTTSPPVIPARRSFNPEIARSNVAKAISSTPKLRDLVERTTQ